MSLQKAARTARFLESPSTFSSVSSSAKQPTLSIGQSALIDPPNWATTQPQLVVRMVGNCVQGVANATEISALTTKRFYLSRE